MSDNIDDLSVEFTQDERLVVKQVDKKILTRGNWTTIMYKFVEMDKKTGEYGQPKVSIRRYQKRSGIYKMQSKFNISSGKQAHMISSALLGWFTDASPSADDAKDESSDD
jgi:hypothetical protein